MRLGEIAGAKIEAGVEALQVPEAAKESIAWELIPVVGPQSFAYMVAFTCPIPGSTDHALHLDLRVNIDPFAEQFEINEFVRSQVHELQAGADRLASQIRASQNGHKSRSGLILPS